MIVCLVVHTQVSAAAPEDREPAEREGWCGLVSGFDVVQPEPVRPEAYHGGTELVVMIEEYLDTIGDRAVRPHRERAGIGR